MYSEQEKKYFIKRDQEDAKGSIKIIKRDFYDDLPRAVCEVLDCISWRWRNYEWFEEAWNKYRDHVINASASGLAIKAPGFVFNDYIDEQVKQDFLNRENAEIMHSDADLTELFHWGIKGQRWGIRLYQNRDGTYTEAGKARYFSTQKDKETGKEVEVFNEKLYQQDVQKYNDDQKAVLEGGKNITDALANRMTPPKGSKRVNKKDYSNLSDEELRKKVNRLSLERQYGDLNGDNKYVMSGREKAREILQSFGAVAGIGAASVTIALGIKHLAHIGEQ